jgi:hypothetical protein
LEVDGRRDDEWIGNDELIMLVRDDRDREIEDDIVD